MRLLVISQTSLLALLVLSFLPSTLHLLSPSSMLEPYAKFSRTIPRHSTGLLARLFPLQEILFHQPLPPAAPIHPSDPSLGIIFFQKSSQIPVKLGWLLLLFQYHVSNPITTFITLHQNDLFICLSLPGSSKLHEGRQLRFTVAWKCFVHNLEYGQYSNICLMSK